MCGIVGLYGLGGRPAPHREQWPALVDLLQHRGPDGRGVWSEGLFFLGHRRLAIIDPTGGQQPMVTPDGRLAVVLNGEIYNDRELRKELEDRGHRFRTQSDTEVVLLGYREWGSDLVRRLKGMFAFAIADSDRRELFLARDRFGEKPLLYYRSSQYIAFASELRVLAALPDIQRRMNPESLAAYLCLNYVPGTDTLLDGVKRLAPATWMRIGPDSEHSETYWSFSQNPASSALSDQDMLAQFRNRLDEAVRLSLRSDVPVGIFLSGGIDSALIAESAVRQGKLNRAYCVHFDERGYSEFGAAQFVAQRLGIPIERAVLGTPRANDFMEMVQYADDPLGDSSAFAVRAVAARARECGNKVVLGGDGGDELLGGYLTYQATALHRRIFSRLPGGIRRAVSSLAEQLPVTEGKVTLSYKLWRFLRAAPLRTGEAHFSWNGAWLPARAASLFKDARLRTSTSEILERIAARSGLNRNTDLAALQRADAMNYLPDDILVKTDRMGMACAIETRAPFLDPEFADWALALPERLKIGPGGQSKVLARRAVAQIYGDAHAQRPKQGFSIPVHAWIRGPLAGMFEDLLSEESIRRMELLDPAPIRRILELHLSKKRAYGFELWGLAVLSAWHRARIQNPFQAAETAIPASAKRNP